MTVAELDAFLRIEIPQMFRHASITIEHADGKTCRVREAYNDGMLRPGGTISGPTLMALPDLRDVRRASFGDRAGRPRQ